MFYLGRFGAFSDRRGRTTATGDRVRSGGRHVRSLRGGQGDRRVGQSAGGFSAEAEGRVLQVSESRAPGCAVSQIRGEGRGSSGASGAERQGTGCATAQTPFNAPRAWRPAVRLTTVWAALRAGRFRSGAKPSVGCSNREGCDASFFVRAENE